MSIDLNEDTYRLSCPIDEYLGFRNSKKQEIKSGSIRDLRTQSFQGKESIY